MKKSFNLVLGLALLLTLAACASNVETTLPAAEDTGYSEDEHDHAAMFPYLGIWFSEDRSSQLIITEAYFYYHEFATNREVYAEIEAVDLTVNRMEVLMLQILHSGQSLGFDTPSVTMTYQIINEQMEITLGNIALSGGSEPQVFLHDEVLND